MFGGVNGNEGKVVCPGFPSGFPGFPSYLEGRQAQNSDPNRQHYSLFGAHNCGTLVCDALKAAGRNAPVGAGPPQNVFGYFTDMRLYFGVMQTFTYTPSKEQVTSKICYDNKKGKTVCK